MSLPGTLRKARELLAGGWSEPLPTDAEGRWCSAQEEGVQTLTLLEALEVAGLGDVADAWELLEDTALPAAAAFGQALGRAAETGAPEDASIAQAIARAPGADTTLQQWLERPGRTLKQVLRLMDLATLRASARETSSTTEAT